MGKSRPSKENITQLLRRYDRPGPRYTSYPTAVEFNESFDAEAYEECLSEANQLHDEPISLYVHLPFCDSRCAFCGCSVVVSQKPEVPRKYVDYVKREIRMIGERLPDRRRVNQLHWGGGTPTHLTPEEIEDLWKTIVDVFDIVPGAEIAIEVDPRVTTHAQVELLRKLGFNRISMGVQDFTEEVQEAIGRHQTREQTLTHYSDCREAGFDSVNVDLVYGLPMQTVETFRANLEELIAIRPDRVAVYSFAHIPWIRGNQRRIDPATLPPPEVKLELFLAAIESFTEAGYCQIGMDHFALPGDELSLAQKEGRLHRNFMGYTVKPATVQLGLGITSIGDLRGAFAQNGKKLSTYYGAIDDGKLPIKKGYRLDEDDKLRRFVIQSLMCNFSCDRREVDSRFGIRFIDYFATELEELAEPEKHGFVRLTDERIDVTETGRLFVRNICMVFDRYLRRKRDGDRPVFSRTV